MDPRWLVVVLANLLLAFLTGQANHTLSHLPASVCLAGLCLPVAALRLRFHTGLIALFLTGLLLDAARPVPFGSGALLLSALLVLWHVLRPRLPREGLVPALAGALLANLVLFFAPPLLAGPDALRSATAGRMGCDLLLSQLGVLVVGPWFFALQDKTLRLWGVDLAREAREPGGTL